MTTRDRCSSWLWNVALSAATLIFVATAASARRRRADTAERADGSARLDEVLDDSFPASDPPSWAPVVGTRPGTSGA